VASGCVTKHSADGPLPPSEELRANLGIIGVAATSRSPRFYGQLPKGKWAGAGHGALNGLESGVVALDAGSHAANDPWSEAFVMSAAAAVSVIGAPVGAIGGAFKGVPERQRLAARAALTNAMAELNVRETFCDRLTELARENTRHVFVPVHAVEPGGPESDNRGSLTNDGVKTVLEVGIEGLLLTGKKAVNPPLKLALSANARLVSAADELELYSCTLAHTNAAARKFTEWAADDARLFREEFDRACRVLAGRMVDKLFVEPSPDEVKLDKPGHLQSELTAFQLIRAGSRYLGPEAAGRVVQVRSERSVGTLAPSVWYVVYYDPTARTKATEIKFADGRKVSITQPARVLELYSSAHLELPGERLRVDSNDALTIARSEPVLEKLTLKFSRLTLERRKNQPVWKVHFWAAKGTNPGKDADIGEVFVSADTGEVISTDLNPGRAD
jgi:hypothetical protein